MNLFLSIIGGVVVAFLVLPGFTLLIPGMVLLRILNRI